MGVMGLAKGVELAPAGHWASSLQAIRHRLQAIVPCDRGGDGLGGGRDRATGRGLRGQGSKKMKMKGHRGLEAGEGRGKDSSVQGWITGRGTRDYFGKT